MPTTMICMLLLCNNLVVYFGVFFVQLLLLFVYFFLCHWRDLLDISWFVELRLKFNVPFYTRFVVLPIFVVAVVFLVFTIPTILQFFFSFCLNFMLILCNCAANCLSICSPVCRTGALFSSTFLYECVCVCVLAVLCAAISTVIARNCVCQRQFDAVSLFVCCCFLKFHCTPLSADSSASVAFCWP